MSSLYVQFMIEFDYHELINTDGFEIFDGMKEPQNSKDIESLMNKIQKMAFDEFIDILKNVDDDADGFDVDSIRIVIRNWKVLEGKDE